MLLISVYSKSVSLCILAYYNEIRKLENQFLSNEKSSKYFELKSLMPPTLNDICTFLRLNYAGSTDAGPPVRYFKHRLAPYLYPYRCYKSMKKHNQDAYVKALERRLAATEDENKLLKLKAEAFETAIQIAEKQFQIPILKKSGTKQSTN